MKRKDGSEITTLNDLGMGKEELEIDPEALSLEVLEEDKDEKLFRIKPRKDHRTFIGDKWYFLKKGVYQNVPAQVKDILMKAGLLDPL